jgi:2'-5' RNA ligase
MKQTVRTFVAVETAAAVRDRAGELIKTLSAARADVKWVKPGNMHITLKFLGDVALKETARICEAVQKAAAETAPFKLEICGAGAFPNANRPRTVWLGAQDDEAMRGLHKQIESRLQKLGFRKDGRRFQTHLTLGRVRRGGPEMAELGRLIRENAAFAAGEMTVSEVIVFASHLAPTGPTYEPLGRAKLMAR